MTKVHSFCKQCLHKYLVFLNWQLMSDLASLERFGEEYLVFLNWRSCRHWPLVRFEITNSLGTYLTTITETWSQDPKNLFWILKLPFSNSQKFKSFAIFGDPFFAKIFLPLFFFGFWLGFPWITIVEHVVLGIEFRFEFVATISNFCCTLPTFEIGNWIHNFFQTRTCEKDLILI